MAARDLIRAGHYHTIVMSVLGHKTDAMFRRYAIVDTTDMRKALQGLAIYREKQRQEEIEAAKNVTPFLRKQA